MSRKNKIMIILLVLIAAVGVGCVVGLRSVRDNMNEKFDMGISEEVKQNSSDEYVESEEDPLVEGVDENISDELEGESLVVEPTGSPEEVACANVKRIIDDGYPCEDYDGVTYTPVVNEDSSITVTCIFNGDERPVTAFCSPDGVVHRFSHLDGLGFVNAEIAFFAGNEWVSSEEDGEYYFSHN